MVEMGRRWLTPLRLSTFLSSRAEKAICSTISRTYCGISMGAAAAVQPGFLGGDGDAFFDGFGIVGANLGADAVLERSDDFAAGGVVLGIGAENQGDVERQAHGVALNLHVAFLHDVEQRDLDFAGEVG